MSDLNKENVTKWAKDKRVQWGIVIVLFLIIFVSSISIRLSNLDSLKDSTTNDYTLADLDAQYFYRIAQTIVDNNGYPEFDEMRSPGLKTPWLKELLSVFIVLVYRVVHPFNSDFSVLDSAVYSPVILYAISVILFFALVYVLTKSKIASIVSTSLLAYSPAFLTRSVAGFADHDIMGMAALFGCFAVLALALKHFEKSWGKTAFFGIISGFMMALVVASWGGAATFILTVIPFAFFIYYMLNSEDKIKNISFYAITFLSSVLSTALLGLAAGEMYNRFTGSYGLLVPFVFVFLVMDYCVGSWIEKKGESKYINKKYEKLCALGITVVLGIIALPLIGKNIMGVVSEIWFKLLFPFGSLTGRLGSTVAENAQPYLNDWIAQMTKVVFYLFLLGTALLGFEIAKHKGKKERLLIGFAWVYMIASILFSRISAGSVFNGENFVSQMFYLSGLLVFFGVFFKQYFNGRFKMSAEKIVLLSLIFFSVINGRSAVRIFLLITPFALLAAGYAIKEIMDYSKETFEDNTKKIIMVVVIVLVLVSSFGIYQYHSYAESNAKYIGASTNYQWQNAMKWARESTSPKDIFVHWWDYGYWIQTIGLRPTVTDGGHSGGDGTDHNIGRYLLTTPNPETALSYMKTWNVSYLLIDPTDMGKYSAYSKIGSDDKYDRFSMIPSGVVDERQTQETKNGTTSVYQIGGVVDEDIIYNYEGKQILIPGPTYDKFGRPQYKAYVAGIIFTTIINGNSSAIEQPDVVFLYNNNQYRVPIRYVNINGNLRDFGSGVEAIAMIIPQFSQDAQGKVSGKNYGAAIYLSPRVQEGLFARLYLMNDPLNQYPTLKIAHQEEDYVVTALRNQGIATPDIVYFNGIRAPLKIWAVEYPTNTETHSEFLINYISEGFGGLDRLFE